MFLQKFCQRSSSSAKVQQKLDCKLIFSYFGLDFNYKKIRKSSFPKKIVLLLSENFQLCGKIKLMNTNINIFIYNNCLG